MQMPKHFDQQQTIDRAMDFFYLLALPVSVCHVPPACTVLNCKVIIT